MRSEKSHSLKWKVIRVMFLCWLFPFISVLGLYISYAATNHIDANAKIQQEQLKFNNRISVERLNHAVFESRKASYDMEILRLREAYLNGSITYDASQNGYNRYLRNMYEKKGEVSAVILFLKEKENIQSSVIYNNTSGGNYSDIRTYWSEDHEDMMEYASELGTRIGFLIRNEKLYLVRNLVDAHFETRGMLIFLLNKEFCFDNVFHSPVSEKAYILIGENEQFIGTSAECSLEELSELRENLREREYIWKKQNLYIRDEEKGDGYSFFIYMKIEKKITDFSYKGLLHVVEGLTAAFVIMLISLLTSFKKEITDPIDLLCESFERIAQGEFGYQIKSGMTNKEVLFLAGKLNQMSLNLDRQIKKIYDEEIALREARIMALQSHINPHFLNNTMEIINWQARLEGNEKISNMIEALSTVLDAAMDRRKLPMVSLREEMGYVNAYLYIMKERLGKKMKVEVNLPEELLSCMVPRLIIQPVIENAIEHGVIPNGNGTVTLKGYRDDRYLFLEIMNDGKMTREDYERVDRLLDMNYDTSKEPSGNLGIANVNQRLRILFGESCGLSVTEKDGKVVALLQLLI